MAVTWFLKRKQTTILHLLFIFFSIKLNTQCLSAKQTKQNKTNKTKQKQKNKNKIKTKQNKTKHPNFIDCN